MSEKIIIIDDQESHAFLISGILESAGFVSYPNNFSDFFNKILNVINSNYAQSDIDFFQKDLYDNGCTILCFVLDIALKNNPNDKSGVEFGNNVLKILYPNTPIVYVSQYRQNQVTNFELRNIDGFVTKETNTDISLEISLLANLPTKIFDVLRVVITQNSKN